MSEHEGTPVWGDVARNLREATQVLQASNDRTAAQEAITRDAKRFDALERCWEDYEMSFTNGGFLRYQETDDIYCARQLPGGGQESRVVGTLGEAIDFIFRL